MEIAGCVVLMLASIIVVSCIVSDIHNETTLRDLMNPLIASLIAAFTFCFSLTFLVFNSTIQRFGRGSYDLLDKKPLLALVVAFFVCLSLSVAVKIRKDQSVVEIFQAGKIAVIGNFVFLEFIVFYFFWLIDHVSSVSILKNLLRNLRQTIVDYEIRSSEHHLKTLVQVVHRVIDEHDYASFNFFVRNACEIQMKLVDLFCKAPRDTKKREKLESLWLAFTLSVAVILEKASEKDTSYLRNITYFYKEKLEAVFSSEASYGTLSPAFSDTIFGFELDTVRSLLWFLAERTGGLKRLVGQNHIEYFFEQTFMSLDVINEATYVPTSILDYFYLISERHKATDFLLEILEINVQLYPYIFSFSQPIASDMRSAITKILEILPIDSLALAEVIMLKQELLSKDLNSELKAYANELMTHVSGYLAGASSSD